MLEVEVGNDKDDHIHSVALCNHGDVHMYNDSDNASDEDGGMETEIQSLKREFQQVRQHIKLLVQKKARLLRVMHRYKATSSDDKVEQHTLNRWKDLVTRYLYADCNNSTFSSQDNSSTAYKTFPLFNLLPNEVILHIFTYFSAKHLCGAIMRTCALFCAISLDESLWKPLYSLSWGNHRVWLLVNSGSVVESSSNSEEINNSCCNNNNDTNHGTGTVSGWRALFAEQSYTERNWWAGRNTVTTLEGHKGAVRCVQFSGDTLVTGSADKSVKLWRLSTGECVDTLHDQKWVRCLRYDAASSTLVTASVDSTQAKIWNMSSKTVAHVFDGQRGWVTSLQLGLPKLITGSLDGKVRIWDLSLPALSTTSAMTTNQQPIEVLATGHDSLRSLYLSGDLLMSAGLERQLLMWDLRIKVRAPAVVVEGAPNGNYCVQFDTQTNTVASGSNGVVAVGDLRATSLSPFILKGHADVVSSLQFSGKKLVTGSMDQTLRVWDMHTHRCAHALHGHESWVWDLQFDPDKIVSVSSDKFVKVWTFTRSDQEDV